MNTTIKHLSATELDRVAGGSAVPDEPTIADYIRIAEEAEEVTLWRLNRYK